MKIKLKTGIYPIEAIISGCYEYLDEAYFFLDGNPEKQIELTVELKKPPKFKLTEKEICNELVNKILYYALRLKISKANKAITEMIVNRAIYASIVSPSGEKRNISNTKEIGRKTIFPDDPLGISVPWEEKFGKNK